MLVNVVEIQTFEISKGLLAEVVTVACYPNQMTPTKYQS